MICTNCNSPYSASSASSAYSAYSAPYESLAVPSPTINPNLPPACQDGVSQYPQNPYPVPVSFAQPSSPPVSSFPNYRYVSQQPTASIYGAQGPNGSVICGMRPLSSIPQQSMWNVRPQACVATESKLDTNVGHFDDYQANFSVTNPITGKTLPTLAALMCPENIAYIMNTIGDMLTNVFGFPIGIQDTPEFRQTINDVAIENPRWMYDVAQGLPLLNNVIIQREFGVHQVALRQQLLYQKYIIEQDRQKFMPYAVSDHTKKGETVNDVSSYSLNQPVPISYECFLTQANLRCKRK